MKKINLTVKDRVNLLSILRMMKGRRIEAMIISSLLDVVIFTPEEIANFQLKDVDGGRVIWNSKSATEKELRLTQEQAEMLIKAMDNMEAMGEFTPELLQLDKKIAELK